MLNRMFEPYSAEQGFVFVPANLKLNVPISCKKSSLVPKVIVMESELSSNWTWVDCGMQQRYRFALSLSVQPMELLCHRSR